MIKIVVRADENLTLFEGQSVVTPSELVRTLHKYWAAPPPQENILWDLRAADVAGITAQTLREAVCIGTDVAQEQGEKARRIAFVGATAMQYGICRMAAAFVELSKHTLRPEVFQTMDDARAWLAGQSSGHSEWPMMA